MLRHRLWILGILAVVFAMAFLYWPRSPRVPTLQVVNPHGKLAHSTSGVLVRHVELRNNTRQTWELHAGYGFDRVLHSGESYVFEESPYTWGLMYSWGQSSIIYGVIPEAYPGKTFTITVNRRRPLEKWLQSAPNWLRRFMPLGRTASVELSVIVPPDPEIKELLPQKWLTAPIILPEDEWAIASAPSVAQLPDWPAKSQ
jgi:hypothetical protein